MKRKRNYVQKRRSRKKPRSSSSYVPTSALSRRSSSSSSSNPVLGYSSSRRSSTSSGRSSVVRAAAQTSGAALGFIHLNVPGAVVGWHYAGQAYDLTHPEKVNQTKSEMGNSTYGGNFNRKKTPRNSFFTQSKLKGFHVTDEIYGNISDPDAVYIHHSTRQLRSEVKVLMAAIIRKGFQLAGITINERDEELPLTAFNESAGFTLQYITIDQISGALFTYAYNTASNQSMTQILDGFTAMDTQMFDYIRNANSQEPHKFILLSLDSAVISRSNVASMINLMSMHVEIQSVSSVKIQNRTIGAAATTDLSTDRVDSQPLICQNYLLKSGDLRQKQFTSSAGSSITSNLLNGCSLTGPNLIRAAQLTGAGFQNRLSPKRFTNCVKTANTILNPGVIKQSSIVHKFYGTMANVFKRMKCVSIVGTTPNEIVNGLQGRSELFIFEEKMRSSSANPVALHYERTYTIGCIVKTKSDVPLLTYFTSSAKVNTV